MNKRIKKKKIPLGLYCTGCPHWQYIKTIKHNKENCEFANECDGTCEKEGCQSIVIKCKYLKYIDYKEESLLWDGCKECAIKEYESKKELKKGLANIIAKQDYRRYRLKKEENNDSK